jgi:predicted component of type VI protein secretion system
MKSACITLNIKIKSNHKITLYYDNVLSKALKSINKIHKSVLQVTKFLIQISQFVHNWILIEKNNSVVKFHVFELFEHWLD